jgi:endonuclease-3
MAKKSAADTAKILEILNRTYPDVQTQLSHRSPFELLVATILSAQCTDRQVNSVTPALFARFKSPRDVAEAPLEEIEVLIFSTGFFHNKALRIKQCCQALIEHHNGRVPDNMDELLALPGVGRKTANVVLNAAFNIPGIVVDTHVKRISKRLGLTANTDPAKVEADLMKALPKEAWIDFSLQLIYLGRALCTARKPRCPSCPLESLCDFAQPGPKKRLKRTVG